MQSKASTVDQYLAELPDDRRAAIESMRKVFLDNLKGGYEEGMQYGMIGYYVPHTIYPAGYHCDPKQPLPFAGLASQKNHLSVYLMSVYGEGEHWDWFRGAWAKTGKTLDMGKCCIRFRKIDDLALDVIAEAISRTPVPKYIEHYENAIRNRPAQSRPKVSAKKASTADRESKKSSTTSAPRKTATKRKPVKAASGVRKK